MRVLLFSINLKFWITPAIVNDTIRLIRQYDFREINLSPAKWFQDCGDAL